MGGLPLYITLSLVVCQNVFSVDGIGFETGGYGNTFGTGYDNIGQNSFDNGYNTLGQNNIGSGYNTIGQNSYHQGSTGGMQCPNQTEFELLELFSADPTFYPVDNIAAELVGRPDLAACLVREVVPPSAPTVPVDNTLLQARPTCPYLEISLQSFFRYAGRCYILRNFQEDVRYVNCLYRSCRKCGDSHGYGNSPHQCVKNYQYVSVWAFCTGLPELSRISRERIIVPTSCSCRKIRCYANTHYGK